MAIPVMKKFLICLIILLSFNSCAQDQVSKQEEYFDIIREDGPAKGIAAFEEFRAAYPDSNFFTEAAMNLLGYEFLGSGQIADAIEIFELNIRAYPDAWNVYDSMGEAYMINGKKEKAIEYYKKSVEINPGNINGTNYIRVLSNYNKYEVEIPMRDGAKLFTSIYQPNDITRSYPLLMKRTPYSVRPYGEKAYNNQLGPSELLSDDGYIFVYQDVRGKYMSEGEYVNVRPHIPKKRNLQDIDESSDTYDTIEWLIKNIHNHNGRVGMWGISYPGFYTAMGAIDAHPALVAVSPQAPVADWFIGDDFHHNGAFFLIQAFRFFSSFGRPRPEPTSQRQSRLVETTPDGFTFFLEMGPLKRANDYFENRIAFWNELMEHGTYDDFWKARNILPNLKNIKPAVLTVGGWFDAEDLYGALNIYQAIERENPGIANTLVMGPWYHGAWARSQGSELGDIPFGSNTSYFYQEQIEFPFFNYYLKGEGKLNLPEAFVFETGSNKWKKYNQWPPLDIQKKNLYLSSDRHLSYNKPDDTEMGFDEYPSDPQNPVPFLSETSYRVPAQFMIADQRFVADRPDVLVYKSDTLSQDLTITGPIEANLFVSTSGTDADWVVKVIDVLHNVENVNQRSENVNLEGFQMLVRAEVMRGKFRNSYEHPEPFTPNQVTPISFTLPDINHTFLKGHQLMVQIQSSWFPLVDRNPQTFTDIYHAADDHFQEASHRIYHTQEYPSHLQVNLLNARD